jgi:hypothetical protein
MGFSSSESYIKNYEDYLHRDEESKKIKSGRSSFGVPRKYKFVLSKCPF